MSWVTQQCLCCGEHLLYVSESSARQNDQVVSQKNNELCSSTQKAISEGKTTSVEQQEAVIKQGEANRFSFPTAFSRNIFVNVTYKIMK